MKRKRCTEEQIASSLRPADFSDDSRLRRLTDTGSNTSPQVKVYARRTYYSPPFDDVNGAGMRRTRIGVCRKSSPNWLCLVTR